MNDSIIIPGPLGKRVSQSYTYDPQYLFAIPRAAARSELNISDPLPFFGADIWNAYELSWLGPQGMPQIAMATIRFAADTLNIVESKSLKLYLNSFNQTRFPSHRDVAAIIEKDLCAAAQGNVTVSLLLPEIFNKITIHPPMGRCLDALTVATDIYIPEPNFLKSYGKKTTQQFYSNLLRTKCPVTGQPDWATVMIDYTGPAIDPEGLLRYLISFREHAGFHENCVERIFIDLVDRCQPERLIVQARYTRRGGIDINPFRSTVKEDIPNHRLARQ